MGYDQIYITRSLEEGILSSNKNPPTLRKVAGVIRREHMMLTLKANLRAI